ncbi:elongation factor 3 [Ascosphaera apis ARSEF 7405]|uniref:Elongation factor 3 n=1 Tax=Ascosphaera apis ARSEF 7405 TaxID=392613 RepID=A0A162ISB3_9EURO|nr:elongation factor 3 [Ascosphaera apis ARSEF 7405]
MAAPIMIAKGPAAPPSQADVAAFMNTIFNGEESQQCLDAAYGLTNLLITSTGYRGLQSYNLLRDIQKGATDKKSGAKRESAMLILGALFEQFPARHPLSEVVFLIENGGVLDIALDALADKGAVVREAAKYAIDALFAGLKEEALVSAMMPALVRYLQKSSAKWQGAVEAYKLLGRMAERTMTPGTNREQQALKDLLREAMGKRLKEIIPVVEAGMHDLKGEVAKQAVKTMNNLTALLYNDDVAPRIPTLINAMEHPDSQTLQKAIHALSQTTFVAVVTSPVLALLTPLLERSLNTPTTPQEVLRQTVVVVENLTKLVHDPAEARVFLPKLKPGVQGVKDRASLPEVRDLATRALDVMEKAMSSDAANFNAVSPCTVEEAMLVLDTEVAKYGGLVNPAADGAFWELAKRYIAEMVHDDANSRLIHRIPLCVGPYLQYLVHEGQHEVISAAVTAHFQSEDERKYGVPPKDDDGEVEIVNADFSLAYGGMLLLSHTNLRLLKGHRYGLCGRNGCGKSTLMRSIAENKLEGFPTPDELKTCFVEHNQGEDADISILEFVSKDPAVAEAAEDKDEISRVLESVGFTAGPEGKQSQKVGSLSGGWKMKLALARAMLMKADVFLLDEPTNHLDVANVKWLQDWLKEHTEITSLIVSHDSGFLDEVCTDILHYEQKKLVHYKGNLADFVKVKPEGKSYYTLSSSNVQFKFPPPGILSGIKSNTRTILRMTNVSYTYPGANKPSLVDASCALSLSSRTAIIGGNGAGKSTFIKLLTGELIPQSGKVEKHPNLRIGYIKQHALEHVEMHMEKTPNQYLQWRYANGDDREVMMKQTRILTDEDREQMEKPIDIGDGRGPRQVEALIGRQKYKKSFQYEVKWRNWLPKFNTMISRETLLELGFQKLVQEFDDHESSREGLGYRILEPKVIAKHFEDVGLDPEIANHNEISGLSGGQKVKVVLAGAMWNNPHLLVLDEPTNFLDRDSLGGLAVAIRDYKGGVVMISHNEEFVGALCPEQWHIEDGRMTRKTNNAVCLDRFEDSSRGPSTVASSVVSSAAPSTVTSGVEDNGGELKFKAKKKKKMTRAQMKEREVRRRLRHIEWLNSPKGTPHPPDTDDEA